MLSDFTWDPRKYIEQEGGVRVALTQSSLHVSALMASDPHLGPMMLRLGWTLLKFVGVIES